MPKDKKIINPMKKIEDLSQAIKKQPKNPIMYNNRGSAYHSLKHHELAIEDYNKTIGLKKIMPMPTTTEELPITASASISRRSRTLFLKRFT